MNMKVELLLLYKLLTNGRQIVPCKVILITFYSYLYIHAPLTPFLYYTTTNTDRKALSYPTVRLVIPEFQFHCMHLIII